MTEPRRATLEQWIAVRMMESPLGDDPQNNAKILDLIPLASCLLELRDRIAALEAAFASHGEQISGLHSQHNLVVDSITDLQGCVNQLKVDATPQPAPDHSRGATEMVATDEELVEAFRVCSSLRAIYNLGRQHGTQPRQGEPTPPPAPVGGLVQEISRQLPLRPVEIRGVISAVAGWLQQRSGTIANGSQWAEMLRREADQ